MLPCKSVYVRFMKLRLFVALCLFSVNCLSSQSIWSALPIYKNLKIRKNSSNEVFNSGIGNQPIRSNNIILDSVAPRLLTSAELRVMDSIKGHDDAVQFYFVDELEIYITGGITIICSPILGVIPAVVFSRKKIPDYKLNPLNIQNTDLKNNSTYYSSYVHQAQKMKKKQIWRDGWAIPSILWAAIGAVLVVSTNPR